MKADIFNLTRVTYVIALGASINNLVAGILEPSVAPYLEILGASSQEIGTILSARFLVVAIASIPLALFASKIGLKRFLYVSGLGTILAGFALFFIEGTMAIFLFYLAIGFTNAIFNGPGTALIAENTGTKRITAFSLLSATWMIPSALGALISTIWFWNTTDYTPENLSSIFPLTVLLIFVGSTLFIVLLIFANHNESTYDGNTNEDVKRVSIINQYQILFMSAVVLPLSLLMLSEFLSGAGAGSSLPYLTPYLKNLGATPGDLSILVFFMNIFMGIAVQLSPILAKKFGDLNVFTVTMMASVLCLIGMIISRELIFSAAFFTLRGAFANMNGPIAQSRMINYIETRVRATGVATISTVRWVGWSLFSPVSGRLIDEYGYNIAFSFTSIIYIVSLVIFLSVVQKFKTIAELKSESNA
jgi:MFS family permease